MELDLDERMLRRIVATLVALAVLAERAAVRSFLVRWCVLAVLRQAEGVLCRYVAEVTGLEPFVEDDARPGSAAADAAMLGWRLRWLAAFLGALLDQACAVHGWTPGRRGPRRHARPAGLRPAAMGAGAIRPYDTS